MIATQNAPISLDDAEKLPESDSNYPSFNVLSPT